jgi:transcriptional regulator with XRE-family HTH domain
MLAMSSRSNGRSEADRISQRLLVAVSDELREARMLRGASQASVARHIGVSRHRVGRVERRKVTTLSLGYLSRHSAAVGLRLSVKLYPAGGGLRDAAQARYIARFVERIGETWRVMLEATIPLPGDLRAVDVLLDGPCRICVEVITRLRDLQAQIRRLSSSNVTSERRA